MGVLVATLNNKNMKGKNNYTKVNNITKENDNKNAVIRARVTQQEKEEILDKVDKLNITLSDFLRMATRDITPLEKDVKTRFFSEVDSKVTYLGNLSNNLNQLTKLLHILNKKSAVSNENIIDVQNLLSKIRPAVNLLNNTLDEFLEEIQKR